MIRFGLKYTNDACCLMVFSTELVGIRVPGRLPVLLKIGLYQW